MGSIVVARIFVQKLAMCFLKKKQVGGNLYSGRNLKGSIGRLPKLLVMGAYVLSDMPGTGCYQLINLKLI